MKSFAAALVCLALAAAGCAPAVAPPAVPAPAMGLRDAPVVVLVSFDGWRWDYFSRMDVPNLKALASRGVRSEGLIPAFPSKTFPNHYTIVTGLYPEHHGITSNTMVDQEIGQRFSRSAETARDHRWWGGEPLWVTAIRQGRRATSMFWPGSDVEIGGVRPNEWRTYDDGVPNQARVEQVLKWLSEPAATRPSFITLYFSDVDTAGHDYGPSAPETFDAARRLDGLLGQLMEGITSRALDGLVTLVVVSDHGMSELAPERRIFLDDYLDVSTVDVVDWSPVAQLWPRSGSADVIYKALRGRHPQLAVYRREEMPPALHFSKNPRIAPVVALASDGWAITTRERFAELQASGRLQAGDHGYAPSNRSMHGLFVAAGPTLQRGLVVPAFENVHLYEFMCRVLGLRPAKNDGARRRTEGMFLDHAAFVDKSPPWRSWSTWGKGLR